jgi:hypothetical protein
MLKVLRHLRLFLRLKTSSLVGEVICMFTHGRMKKVSYFLSRVVGRLSYDSSRE